MSFTNTTTPSNPAEIFISRNGNRMGPYTPDALKMYLSTGQLYATDLAWKVGMPDWVPLSTFEIESLGVPRRKKLAIVRQKSSIDPVVHQAVARKVAQTRSYNERLKVLTERTGPAQAALDQVGLVWFALAVLCFLALAPFVVLSVKAFTHPMVQVMAAALAAATGGLMLLGHLLRNARIRFFRNTAYHFSALLAVLLLFGFPIGTAAGLFVLYRLYQAREV